MSSPSLAGNTPVYLLGAGVVCFLGGYGLLQYAPRSADRADELAAIAHNLETEAEGTDKSALRENARIVRQHLKEGGRPYALAGRVLFWLGLVGIVVGVYAWATQPAAARAKPRRAETPPEEEEFDDPYEADLGIDDDSDSGDENNQPAVVPCPFCGKDYYEDSERCPSCGNFISREDEARSRPAPPLWLALGVLAGLYAVGKLLGLF